MVGEIDGARNHSNFQNIRLFVTRCYRMSSNFSCDTDKVNYLCMSMVALIYEKSINSVFDQPASFPQKNGNFDINTITSSSV